MTTPAPASLAAQVEAEKGLPEEIAAAIEIVIGQASAVIHEAHEGSSESMMRAVARKEQARAALAATIIARLTAAESAREVAVVERDAFRDKLAEMFGQLMLAEGSASKLRAERDAAGRAALSREKDR